MLDLSIITVRKVLARDIFTEIYYSRDFYYKFFSKSNAINYWSKFSSIIEKFAKIIQCLINSIFLSTPVSGSLFVYKLCVVLKLIRCGFGSVLFLIATAGKNQLIPSLFIIGFPCVMEKFCCVFTTKSCVFGWSCSWFQF